MENQRLILFIALALVGVLLWQAWETRHAPVPAPAATGAVPAPSVPPGEVPDMPPALSGPGAAPQAQAAAAAEGGQRIRVITDVLEVELDSVGGDVRHARLLAYPVSLKNPQEKVLLMSDQPARLFVAQSGLISRSAGLPDHHARYRAESTEYRLAEGQNELKVALHWESEAGLRVTKTLTFHRDSYAIDVDYHVTNGTAEAVSLAMYRQLQRGGYVDPGENSLVYTFTGGVVSNSLNKYDKIEFDDMASWRSEQDFAQGGWVAMLQHYFTAAWLAEGTESNRFYTKALPTGTYVLGMSTPEQQIAPQAAATLHTRMFVGPKDQARMETVEPTLKLTVDYGIFSILADPLFWLLTKINDFLGNWGWSIIVLTVLIKIVFYKLTETQYRSMAQLRKLQPKMEALKERYGDDRQKMGQAMMELYRTEKVNPLAGCVPILIQIPVFIALYWVLVESVEMRQAPFILWINDLTAKDPFFVLPVLMGISMYIMQKLSPMPTDPVQAKVMMSLPFVFTIFFAFFPSGLVLYWFANNLLSILQQWYITRKLEKAAA
ncbi:MAG: membrane protein insertase YidC [Pseudomonadota bacterium]